MTPFWRHPGAIYSDPYPGVDHPGEWRQITPTRWRRMITGDALDLAEWGDLLSAHYRQTGG